MGIDKEPWISRYRISVEAFHRMSENGVFDPEARVELIEGEIVNMAPPGPIHVGNINALTHWLARAFGDRGIVSVQNPLILSDDTQPQPDFAVLRFRNDYYRHALPQAADALLVVEVADSSVDYDRKVKAALYAAAAVPEYWIVDCRARKLVVHRDPAGESWRSVEALDTPCIVRPVAAPDIAIPLGPLFSD